MVELDKGLELKIKIIDPEAKAPSFAHESDAGFDVYTTENFILESGERHKFKTGLISEIPTGYYIEFDPKSGLADKVGIQVLAGTIDVDYRGEWGVILYNSGKESYEFKKGDKIVQGKIREKIKVSIVVVSELSDTERGTGGFGSTGR